MKVKLKTNALRRSGTAFVCVCVIEGLHGITVGYFTDIASINTLKKENAHICKTIYMCIIIRELPEPVLVRDSGWGC